MATLFNYQKFKQDIDDEFNSAHKYISAIEFGQEHQYFSDDAFEEAVYEDTFERAKVKIQCALEMLGMHASAQELANAFSKHSNNLKDLSRVPGEDYNGLYSPVLGILSKYKSAIRKHMWNC